MNLSVPLACYANKKNLTIFRNSRVEYVPFPFLPRCYVHYQFEHLTNQDSPVWKRYIDLWKKTPVSVYEKTFENPIECAQFFAAYKHTGHVFALPYIEQILSLQPNFFRQFPNTEPLKVFTFDIEVASDGGGSFPTPERNPIIAISYKCGDADPVVLADYDEQVHDKYILEQFLDAFCKYDPDIVTGYNIIGKYGDGFDIPYIIRRMEKHHLDINKLCRADISPVVCNNDEITYNFFGRCIFDVYLSVLGDQSLLGIKNKKLKTVAKWYGISAIELDMSIDTTKYIGTQELIDYVASDVHAAYELYKIYIQNQLSLADLMGIPLDLVVHCSPSFIPRLFNARHLLRMRMIPFQSNVDRYPQLKGKKFQAALANLVKPGLFKEVYGVDVASFYPSLMRTFNLSPETVQIIGIRPYTQEPIFASDGKTMFVQIPDNNFKYNFFLKIKLQPESFTKQELTKFFEIRNTLKQKIVEAKQKNDTALAARYKSQSDAIKVIMNSIFGVASSETTWLSDIGVGIAIVGLARWILSNVIKYLGESVVMYDTDGLMVDKKVDFDALNAWVADLIYKTARVTSYIRFDYKGKFEGYFYKTKNYILKNEQGKFERHGVSMKSSRTSRIYDKVIDLVAHAVFNQTDEKEIKALIDSVFKMDQFTLDDFMMRTRITKDSPNNYTKNEIEKLKEQDIIYKNENALQPMLMQRARELFNMDVRVGDYIDYFKTRTGYKLAQEVTSRDELDMEYYRGVIDRALAVFHLDEKTIKNQQQLKLFK